MLLVYPNENSAHKKTTANVTGLGGIQLVEESFYWIIVAEISTKKYGFKSHSITLEHALK